MEQLNILILTLVSGEEVIANLKDHSETVDGVERKVCYNMVYPFTLTRQGSVHDKEVGVMFTPWKFFSSDTSYLIGYDKIINMCAPLPNVIQEYKRAVDGLLQTLAEQQQ
tara:strand:+ start:604 stop:933 length:330 start_codon:yes stop_codon:yes gene_type:complete